MKITKSITILIISIIFLGIFSAIQIKYVNASTTIILNSDNLGNVADTHVAEWNTAANYGGDTIMDVINSSGTGNDEWSFVLWNLTDSMPTGSEITNATFSVHSDNAIWEIYCYNTTSGWSESTITWANKPSLGTLQDISPDTVFDSWIYFDVTDACSYSFIHYRNMSLCLISTNVLFSNEFYTKEFSNVVSAQLEITYETISPPEDYESILNNHNYHPYAQISSGTQTAYDDTWAATSANATNNALYTCVSNHTTPFILITRYYEWYDLSVIPTDATIVSATVQIYNSGTDNTFNQLFTLVAQKPVNITIAPQTTLGDYDKANWTGNLGEVTIRSGKVYYTADLDFNSDGIEYLQDIVTNGSDNVYGTNNYAVIMYRTKTDIDHSNLGLANWKESDSVINYKLYITYIPATYPQYDPARTLLDPTIENGGFEDGPDGETPTGWLNETTFWKGGYIVDDNASYVKTGTYGMIANYVDNASTITISKEIKAYVYEISFYVRYGFNNDWFQYYYGNPFNGSGVSSQIGNLTDDTWRLKTYSFSTPIYIERITFYRAVFSARPFAVDDFTVGQYAGGGQSYKPYTFYSWWNDTVGLKDAIFGCNLTGAWVNETIVIDMVDNGFGLWIEPLESWVDRTLPLNTFANNVVEYCFWVNSTTGGMNNTGLNHITVYAGWNLAEAWGYQGWAHLTTMSFKFVEEWFDNNTYTTNDISNSFGVFGLFTMFISIPTIAISAKKKSKYGILFGIILFTVALALLMFFSYMVYETWI